MKLLAALLILNLALPAVAKSVDLEPLVPDSNDELVLKLDLAKLASARTFKVSWPKYEGKLFFAADAPYEVSTRIAKRASEICKLAKPGTKALTYETKKAHTPFKGVGTHVIDILSGVAISHPISDLYRRDFKSFTNWTVEIQPIDIFAEVTCITEQ